MMWTPPGGWALVDPQERIKTVSKEDATRLREDALRLKEERREEVQIVSDSQVTVRPKVKTETSEKDDSIMAGFNPSFHSSVIKEPPATGKISSAGLKNALKKVLPGSSVLTQPAEGPKPTPGDRVGLVAFLTLPLLGAPPAAEREVAPAPASTAPGAIHQVKMENGATVGLTWPIAVSYLMVISG